MAQFFQFPSKVLALILLFLQFLICGQLGQQSPQFCKFTFLVLKSYGRLVVWVTWGDPFVCKNSIGDYMCHSPGLILGCAYAMCSYGLIYISCASPSGSPDPPSYAHSSTPSLLICYIRLLSDWWFRVNHEIAYICYFLASNLFSLWHDWFLWRFVLLSGEILFLSLY